MVVKQSLDTVFHALAGGGALIRDVAEPFVMSKQAVSKHRRVLEDAGLVMKLPEGRTTRVMLQPGPLRQVRDWVAFYSHFWAGSLAALGDLVDGEAETGERRQQR